PVVALLVEIDRPHPVLPLLEVTRDVDDEVAGVHVAEQANETPRIELDELLGQPHLVVPVLRHVLAREHVPRYADDVLLDDRLAADEIVYTVRRQDVLELEAVHAIGVDPLDVKVVEEVVDPVDRPNPEGQRVSVQAQVYAVDVDVLCNREVAVEPQGGVGLPKLFLDLELLGRAVKNRRPERIPSMLVV